MNVLIRATLLVRLLAAVLLVAGSTTIACADESLAESDFYLRDGDSVVFYGDSITEEGHYAEAIENFVVTRMPEREILFINSGWSGDRAWGGDGGMLAERLTRDVIAHRPTVVTVMLGMNDGYYTNYDPEAVSAFKSSLIELITTLQKELPGVRITLIGTSPFDGISPGERPKWEEEINGGYAAVVARFSAAAREVANEHGLLFVDVNEPLVRVLTAARDQHGDLVNQFIPDRIHPGPAAGLIMAACLLDAWKAPRANGIEFDVKNQQNELSWTAQNMHLPMPLDVSSKLTHVAFELSPELALLCRQTLRVENVPMESAALKIDGSVVGSFTKQELAKGVDLSTLGSPLFTRATEVAQLTHLRNEMQFLCWRRMEPLKSDTRLNAIHQPGLDLRKLENQVVALQRQIARPAPHHFELIPADR